MVSKINKIKNIALLLVVTTLFQNCATVFSIYDKDITRVKGTPEKALVYLNGEFVSNTPTKLKLKRFWKFSFFFIFPLFFMFFVCPC